MDHPNPLENSPRKSDDELLAIADESRGLWINQDGVAETLLDALLHAASISSHGRTPFRLIGPENMMIGHEQMLRLWALMGISPAKSA